MTWIATQSGRRFSLVEPRAADVHLPDVCHALAMTCRWGGHARWHYSVAQHSFYVLREARRRFPDELELHLWAGLHDAPEAYVGDCPTPLKRLLPDFADRERAVLDAVVERFALTPARCPEAVVAIDRAIRTDEAAALLPPAVHAAIADQCGDGLGIDIESWLPGAAASVLRAAVTQTLVALGRS